jgi:[acyl-carrier-protein] S-malonyltransferase
MAPAAERMAEELARVAIRPAAVPVLSNVRVAPLVAPEEIRAALVEQVTGMVRWRESMERLAAEGLARAYEIGAGKVLAGLMKRIAPAVSARPVNAPADVAAVAAELAPAAGASAGTG